MNDRVHDSAEIRLRLIAAGVLSEPGDIVKLLRAMAGSSEAKANRHDTILIAAAEMIEAYDRIATELI